MADAAKPGLWRVVWEQPAAGQGHDVVEAPTGQHAVWYIAADYAQKGITDLAFVRVEAVPAADVIMDDNYGEIQVVMTPGIQEPFREWLASRGLHLFPIPVEDDLPTYGIGIGGGTVWPT